MDPHLSSRQPDHVRAEHVGHILRDQLDVTEDEFWKCAQDGILPKRGTPDIPSQALPAELVYLLINKVGLTEPTSPT
jgi:hypothetical protein